MSKSPQKFVILASQRTGSTMLTYSLMQHPSVTCFGELFHQYTKPPWWLAPSFDKGLDERFLLPSERNEFYRAYLDEVFSLHSGSDLIGFKIMLVQNKAVIKSVCQSPDWRIVRLYRRNLLAVYGASLVAKATKQVYVLPGQKAKLEKVTFVAKEFEQFAHDERRRRNEIHELLHNLGRSYFCIEYLDMVSGGGLAEVGRYLGIPSPESLTHSLNKRHDWNVMERFANPDDVYHYLKQHKLTDWAKETPLRVQSPLPEKMTTE